MAAHVLIVLEGVRPDALVESGCTNIHSLMHGGSYALQARTVFPSLSLPSHMSLIHSIPPIEHLVVDDEADPGANRKTGFLDLLGRSRRKAGFFYSQESLRYLSRPGALAFSYYQNQDHFDGEVDVELVSRAISWMERENPDLVLLDLNQADEAGHQHGWMTPEYLQVVRNLDRTIGVLMDRMPSASRIFLVGSHGGHGFHHGTKLPEDVNIPWIACGPGIRSAYQISRQVSIMDTIPTLAAFMGLNPEPQWRGSVITEIFEGSRVESGHSIIRSSSHAVGA